MHCDHSSCRQLVDAVQELIRTAASDLAPPDKLELLCIQIGTAQHWLSVVEQQLAAEPASDPPLHGPHWESSRANTSPEADVSSHHLFTERHS
jgi:hypothetical protein